MSKERQIRRQEAAQDAAAQIHRTEDAVDSAFRELALLNAALPGFRARAELSAVVGHDVYEALSQAQANLVGARGDLVRAHGLMEEVGKRIRVTADVPPGVDKPPNGALDVRGALSVVAAA